MVEHKKSSKHPLGYYGLPGGRVNAGEQSEDAAPREVKEETGLDVNKNDLQRVGIYTVDVERRVGEEEASITLYSCRKFRGKLKGGDETIPLWAKIPDVLEDKYKMPRISGNFISDVKKLLKSNYSD